jgi:hypothetical protein
MKEQRTCVLCDARPATTRDHVPPSNIFLDPKPANLVTVPACEECNGGAKVDDEAFRNYLALHVGARSESGAALWKQSGIRGIAQNGRFMRDVILPAERVLIATKAGVITGRGRRVQVDTAVVARVVSRMVRGLYYRCLRQPLAADAVVSVSILKGIGAELVEVVRDWPGRSIGKGQFLFRFNYATENPRVSHWLFGFHRALWIRALTDEHLIRGDAVTDNERAAHD